LLRKESFPDAWFSEYIFIRPVFSRFCPKSAAVRPQNLSAYHLLSTASFVLFCGIFGRMATVATLLTFSIFKQIATKQFNKKILT
jgi:hypothetical protein